jgi:hypothetical protein
MKNEFIPYEQALALKELGFDEPCFGWWFADEETLIIEKSNKSTSENIIQALTYSQAFRWFRKKYGLEGVTQRAEDFMWYKWTIYQYNENGKKYVFDWCEYETYEKAELECLKKLIEICKNK